jgi:hypothetical protein
VCSLFVCAVFGLATSATAATQNYSFAGHWTSSRGKIINIPMVGNTPCPPLILHTGPGSGMKATPALHKIIRGVNTQPQMSVTANFSYLKAPAGRDLQCVKQAPNLKLVTNADGKASTAKGKGGGFALPVQAWLKPFPGKVRAVQVKYVPPVIQLATSFKITGPRSKRTTPPAGSMCAPMTAGGRCGTVMTTGTVMNVMTVATNIAPARVFEKSAFLKQTGRAGAMFTWCPASPPKSGAGAPCNFITQAGPNLIVKYTGGGNAFGGTMAYVITTGTGVSSLALGNPITGFPGAVVFQKLSGMGSQPTGRGYADFLTDYLDPGPVWLNHMRATVNTTPVIGPQNIITMVTGYGGKGKSGSNANWGFPFTTMTVLVRVTGAKTTTLTGMGFDKRGTPTAMGNRNISLVAGGLAVATLAPPIGQLPGTPEIASMFLPEPAKTAQLVAGVAALLGVAYWRSRKVR